MKQTTLTKLPKYIFIDKALFFPQEGILTIGDLHIGFETLLHRIGVEIPLNLTTQAINDLKKIFNELRRRKLQVNKVIFIGDIKHHFNVEYEEKKEFFKIMNYLERQVKNPHKDIILIKGNHDTFDFSGKKMKEFYIDSDVAFIHGHEEYEEAFSKEIKYVVMGHLHPSIRLTDKAKSEKFKCFLVGPYRKKEFIILPSFFNVIEGTDVNDYSRQYKDYFSIIPRRYLLKFKAFIIGENTEDESKIADVYDFGKVKNL